MRKADKELERRTINLYLHNSIVSCDSINQTTFIIIYSFFFEREENNQDFWDWASVTKIYGCWPCVKILANCVKICDKFASNWERERRLCFGEKWERISNWKLSFKNMFVLFFYLLNEEEIRIKKLNTF